MSVRDQMPPALLDSARTVRDRLEPGRRRGMRERLAHRDDLAARVSPDGSVLAGPFAGIRFPFHGSWGGFAARLAGTYEQEIQPHVEAAIAAEPSLVLDVGAAEGYYAVGLARRLPDARVISYDIDPIARKTCKEAAAINHVENLTVRGRISPSALRRRLKPHSLLVCDVEGYEIELLDPVAVPALREVSMICELHDFIVPGVTETITARFSSSHDIEVVPVGNREVRPVQLEHLDETDWRLAVAEGRELDMRWLIMIPRTGGMPRTIE